MKIRDILAKANEESRTALLYQEAKEVLEAWGIPVSRFRVAGNQDEAARAARFIGYPVVMKVLSPDVVHKKDVGGVLTLLRNKQDVLSAYESIEKNVQKALPGARTTGVVVEAMCSGIEAMVGVTRDPQFGHAILFGMGGTLVEVLNDVAFRLIPLDPGDAGEMIEEVKGSRLFQGYRGMAGDIESLKSLLLKTSELAVAYPEIVEMDMNPVFNSPRGSIVADARISVERR